MGVVRARRYALHFGAVQDGEIADPRGEPGLTNAWLANEHYTLTLALFRPPKTFAQHQHFFLAAHKRQVELGPVTNVRQPFANPPTQNRRGHTKLGRCPTDFTDILVEQLHRRRL